MSAVFTGSSESDPHDGATKLNGFIPDFSETSGEISEFMKMHVINLAYKKNINDPGEALSRSSRNSSTSGPRRGCMTGPFPRSGRMPGDVPRPGVSKRRFVWRNCDLSDGS